MKLNKKQKDNVFISFLLPQIYQIKGINTNQK